MNLIHRTKAAMLTFALLALPVGAGAGITEVTIRVDGLSCPFCAYSLEKYLKAIPGTQEPVINVKEGLVTLKPAAEEPVHFAALRAAVKKAGFTPRELGATGTAVLETTDGQSILRDEDGASLFNLEANDALAALERGTIDFTGAIIPPQEDKKSGRLPTLSLITAAPHDGDGGTP